MHQHVDLILSFTAFLVVTHQNTCTYVNLEYSFPFSTILRLSFEQPVVIGGGNRSSQAKLLTHQAKSLATFSHAMNRIFDGAHNAIWIHKISQF